MLELHYQRDSLNEQKAEEINRRDARDKLLLEAIKKIAAGIGATKIVNHITQIINMIEDHSIKSGDRSVILQGASTDKTNISTGDNNTQSIFVQEAKDALIEAPLDTTSLENWKSLLSA